MRAGLILGGLAALFASAAPLQAAWAQTPSTDLAKPPAGAQHFIIESTGGKHGDSWSWTAADGARMARETWNLRGQAFDSDLAGRAGADGMIGALTIRGFSPTGDAGESFKVEGGKASWKSPVDAGEAPYKGPAFYITQGGPAETNGWFLEQLLAAPGRTLALLPGGRATATRLADTEVGEGAAKQTVTLWSVSGIANSPITAWTDDKGKFFGQRTGVVAWLPEAYAGELVKLTRTSRASAMAAQAAQASTRRHGQDPGRAGGLHPRADVRRRQPGSSSPTRRWW